MGEMAQISKDSSTRLVLHKIFEEQIKRAPDNVGLEFSFNVSMTYHELNETSNLNNIILSFDV